MLAKPLSLAGATLGESPFWNKILNELSIVDIERGTQHTFNQCETGWVEKSTRTLGKKLGAAVPCDDGSYLFCQSDGVWRLAPDREPAQLTRLPMPATHRINDAKLGPDGWLWFGVMHLDALEGEGSLWRLSAQGQLEQLLDSLTIPNGMDWTESGFWFVDGPRKEISHYERRLSGLGSITQIIPTSHTPDGLLLDADGNIWVALWGGGRVVCFSSSGESLAEISVPAPHTTSMAFIGPGYTDLVITSARLLLSDAELESFPASGDIFLAQNVARGREPYYRFGL